jgi:hypothetical protein
MTLVEIALFAIGGLMVIGGIVMILIFLPTLIVLVVLIPFLLGVALLAGGMAMIQYAWRSHKSRGVKKTELKVSYKLNSNK